MKRSIRKMRVFRTRREPGRERGSIMILTAVLITGLVGMLALSIDLGFLFSARNQFQNGIDAATLAAGTALRTSIENDVSVPHQTQIATLLARQFGGANQVRRYPDPDPMSGQANANNITIDPAAISVDSVTDPPQVTINTRINMPTIFAGIVGIYTMDIAARSTASVFPVDGGTGTMGSGTATGAGCWRPLMLPDTFYDASGTPVILYSSSSGGPPQVPEQNGYYYRSRFAAGARSAYPFVDSFGGVGASVTGLRDTQLQAEMGLRTIMGANVEFRGDSYFVADFSGLPRATFDVLSVTDMANFGYCGELRVGEVLPVFPRGDATRIEQVRAGLIALKSRTLDFDLVDANLKAQYRYVSSSTYPGPNTHGAIIPVLFYNPYEHDANPATLMITNFGLFFLEDVKADGSISGFFVREIITGGTPIAPGNMQGDSDPTFKRSWLPASVRLLR
ncbi:MAG: pilus assembly protein TadG-related protein [Blastocatellia bacterium]